MNQLPVMEWANGSLIAANTLLGVILADHLNLVAAGIGVLVTVAGNLGKIADSIARLNAIRKNGWLPIKPDADPENEQQQ